MPANEKKYLRFRAELRDRLAHEILEANRLIGLLNYIEELEWKVSSLEDRMALITRIK